MNINWIAQKDSSKKKVKTNKIHWILNEIWRKIKQMFPDYSGKYHGKLNDKRTQMTEK